MAHTFAETRYDKMQYNRCGNSGLKLPGISLGCWWNFSDKEQGRGLLRKAFDLGITHFDLANNYGPPAGSAEENVGNLLKEDFAGHRDELIISSKAGYLMWPGPYGEWGSKKYLISSLDQSLKRLKLDYVDIFYSHRFDPDTPLEETIGALDQIVKQGKALYVGISSYNSQKTFEASQILKNLGTPLAIHQPSYSILNQKYADDGTLERCERTGIGVIAFCPLAQGLLTDKYLNGIPDDSRAKSLNPGMQKRLTPEFIKKLNKLNDVARKRDQSLALLSLQWVIQNSAVTSALIGASRQEQIEENVKALDGPPLTEDEMAEIQAIVKEDG